MCAWCTEGPPTWLDVELAVNSNSMGDTKEVASILWQDYWSRACSASRTSWEGLAYRSKGLNWMDA